MKLKLSRSRPERRRSRLTEAPKEVPASFAYRSRRAGQDDSRNRFQPKANAASLKNLRQFWVQRFGLAILVVAALVSAVNVLTLSPTAKVMPLDGSTSSFLRPVPVYEQAANKILAGSIWNRNKVTVDTSELNKQLQAQFPELANLSVTIPLLAHRPLIYVEPARPALIMQAANGSFVIDSTGKTLARDDGSKVIQELKLPQLNDQSGLKLRLNRQALPAQNVSFIQNITAQLAAKQLAISGMTLPGGASELDVQVAGQPYFVKFNLQRDDPRGQAGTFLATIGALHKQNINPAKYVDVRADGRAYYQ